MNAAGHAEMPNATLVAEIPVANGDVKLPLYRVAPPARRPGAERPFRKPVLLVHGGSASSRTFVTPSSASLAEELSRRGFDVFLLDWRGSHEVTRRQGARAYDATTMDACAEEDLPAALDAVRAVREASHEPSAREPVGVVAHCFGAGVVAIALAKRALRERVDAVVLLTLGLFYEVGWDGLVKAGDHLLERVRAKDPNCTAVSSHERPAFPKPVDEAFGLWPRLLLPDASPAIYRRVAFMFGPAYHVANVPPEIHRDEELARQFGEMHLRLYQHGTQNVRRGFAAPFDAPERARVAAMPRRAAAMRKCFGATPPTAVAEPEAAATAASPIDAYLDPHAFATLERLTLITGYDNALWHRSSIDRMHDFVRRAMPSSRAVKHVMRGFAHQDLLWGRRAPEVVFPSVVDGLRSARR